MDSRQTQLLAAAESARRALLTAPSDAVEQRIAAAEAFWRAAADLTSSADAATDLLVPIVGGLDPLGAAAARVLAPLATPRATQTLLDAAYSSELAISQRALVALLSVHRNDAAAQMMIERYRSSPEDSRSTQLLDAIARQPVASILSFATDLLTHSRAEDPLVRFIGSAGRQAGREGSELAEQALASKLPRVRLAAAWVLVLRGERQHLDVLLDAAAARQPALREYAMLACAGLPFRECAAPVVRGLADSSSKVSMAALLAAPLVGHRDLVEPAVRLLEASSRQVAAQAEAVFRDLTGNPPPPTPQAALAAAHSAAAAMHPATRYFRGRPLAMSQLVELLVTAGYAPSANSNLIAASGLDFGFDPAQDLIANLASFKDWRKWLSGDGNALAAGVRYYYGREL